MPNLGVSREVAASGGVVWTIMKVVGTGEHSTRKALAQDLGDIAAPLKLRTERVS